MFILIAGTPFVWISAALILLASALIVWAIMVAIHYRQD
jgi:sensor domain CHASE-containing protein